MLRSIASVNGGSSCPFRFCTRVSPCPGGCLGSHAEPRRSPDVTQRSAQSASDRRWPTWCILSSPRGRLLGDLVTEKGPPGGRGGVAFSRHSAGSQNLLDQNLNPGQDTRTCSVGPPQRRPAKPTTHSSKYGTSPVVTSVLLGASTSQTPTSERRRGWAVGGAGAGALVVVPCAWCLVTAHERVCTSCRVCRAAIEGWCRSWCWYRIPTRELVCHGARGAPWR